MYKQNSKTTNPPNSLPLPYTQLPASQPAKKEPRQPMRTSKLGNKLKVLPTHAEAIAEENEDDDQDPDELEDDDERGAIQFYTPLSQIPAGTARRDAQRLTKTEKAKLPRVTAYCTAANYDLPALLAYLSARPDAYRCHPRLFDTECVHTPYLPPPSSSSHPHSAKAAPSSPRLRPQVPEGDLLNLDPSSTQAAERELERKKKRQTGFSKRPGAKRGKSAGSTAAEDSEDDDWEEEEWVPDVFVFEYGTVVVWGMTEKEEKRLLNSFRKFEIERLGAEDVEMEDLNFYYADYSRIYNDVITLRKGSSYMTKLSLSHALSQSVKISLFEELISSTIEQTKDLPKSLSETGKIGMPRSEIMKQIGNLFILRININLVGSILDSPEFFWSFPDLEPLYNAARSYLEISQRIDLLNARVDVLQDMLKLLKESVNSSHGERLEAIVIFLIAIEIVLGIITILVDLSFS